MNIAGLLERSAIRFGDRPALSIHDKLEVSYREFARRVRVLGGALKKRFRLTSGERIALVMSNHPAVYEVMFAAWHAGLVAVPINAKLHRKEVEYIVDHCQARVCFVSEDLAGEFAGLRVGDGEVPLITTDSGAYQRLLADGGGVDLADIPGDAPAWIFYTSGTTGKPKGAVLTHRNLQAMTLSYFADIDTIGPGDTIIHAAPMSHGSGLYGLPHVAMGANNVVPLSKHFDPAEIWTIVEKYRGTTMFAAPTMVQRLITCPALSESRLANLKSIIYGGAPMYVADLEAALGALGPRLVQIYGQGESPMTITALTKDDHQWRDQPRYLDILGSVGFPRTGVEVRVVDPADRVLPCGESGEVVVRGDVVMAGYWNDAAATARTLHNGWLHTGDIGVIDREGFLTLKDRSKDVIISGGSNIYPREVEEVLLRHASVREVSVVGAAHPEWGEQVIAFVACADAGDALATELDALCINSIARFKRPKHYCFLPALPKNDNGKILKTALRALLAQDFAGVVASTGGPLNRATEHEAARKV